MPKRKTSEAEVSPVTDTPIKRAEKRSTTSTVHKHSKSTNKVKVSDSAPAPIPSAALPVITQEQIAVRAYLLWEARGAQSGSELDDWFRAERELRVEQSL